MTAAVRAGLIESSASRSARLLRIPTVVRRGGRIRFGGAEAVTTSTSPGRPHAYRIGRYQTDSPGRRQSRASQRCRAVRSRDRRAGIPAFPVRRVRATACGGPSRGPAFAHPEVSRPESQETRISPDTRLSTVFARRSLH